MKESKEKSQGKQKLQYDKEINKRELQDIHVNGKVLEHNLTTKRIKCGLLTPLFNGSFKVEAINKIRFKVKINFKLLSYNHANLKKGM